MRNLTGVIATGVVVAIAALSVWGWLVLSTEVPEGAGGSWAGVDTNVIEKYAADAGRQAREPLINTDQGDLLLFVFALGAAVGGFIGGYHWKGLISETRQRRKSAD